MYRDYHSVFKNYRGGAARMKRSADTSTVLPVSVGTGTTRRPGLMCSPGRGMVVTSGPIMTSGRSGEGPSWEEKGGLWAL